MSYNILPIDDSIKSILTGSIGEKFQALIEPHALVNTGIFFTLNLTWVFPLLNSANPNLPFLGSISGLPLNWQIVFATIGFFVVSYLFHNLSFSFLNFARGKFFENSLVIGPLMKQMQEYRFDTLINIVKAKTRPKDALTWNIKRDRAAFSLAYNFPVQKSELGLTALDNILLNSASYINHQYGANLDLIWPVIQAKLGDDQKDVKLLQENWVALLFFTSLQVLLIIVAIEVLLVSTYAHNIQWLQILILLCCAYICYYVSLDRARKWGQEIRRIFDLNVKDVFGELGMEAIKDNKLIDTSWKDTLRNISRWLVFGAMKDGDLKEELIDIELQSEWYKKTEEPAKKEEIIVKHPVSLSVERMEPLYQGITIEKSGEIHNCYKQSAQYIFAVTNPVSPDLWNTSQDAYLLVIDPAMPDPPSEVTGELLEAVESGTKSNGVIEFKRKSVLGIRQDGKPAGLLFPLKDIPPGGSQVLRYNAQSPLLRLSCTDQLAQSVKVKPDGKEKYWVYLDINPPQKETIAKVTIELLDTDQTNLDPNAVSTGGFSNPGEINVSGRKGKWSIKVPAKSSLTVTFSVIGNTEVKQ